MQLILLTTQRRGTCRSAGTILDCAAASTPWTAHLTPAARARMTRCMPKIYRERFTVPADANDDNGHVNNVAYVQWMQDVAMRHSSAQGASPELYAQLGSSWVVRSHRVDYLRPAFAGDELEIWTWVCNLRRVRSQRRYRFLRASDQTMLVKAETDWVYINAETGRPRSVHPEVVNAFDLLEPHEEP